MEKERRRKSVCVEIERESRAGPPGGWAMWGAEKPPTTVGFCRKRNSGGGRWAKFFTLFFTGGNKVGGFQKFGGIFGKISVK